MYIAQQLLLTTLNRTTIAIAISEKSFLPGAKILMKIETTLPPQIWP